MRGLLLSLCFALSAITANATLLQDSEYALILSRQAPGTPQYECHSNCGNALAGGRIPNHCDNSTWVGYYEACLDCALDFNIWRIYGSGVSSAAEDCGLSPTPSPSGDDEVAPSSTSAAGSDETSTSTSADDEVAPSSTSAAGDDDSEASTSASGDETSASGADGTPAPTTTAEPSGSFAPSDPPATTEAPNTETGTAAPSPSPTTSVATAAAPRTSVHTLGNLFGVGAMAVVFAGLMGAW
jgi:hypothetical protein